MSENSGSLRRGQRRAKESREVCRRTAGVSGGDKDAQRKQHSLNRFVIVRQIYVAKTPYLKVVGIIIRKNTITHTALVLVILVVYESCSCSCHRILLRWSEVYSVIALDRFFAHFELNLHITLLFQSQRLLNRLLCRFKLGDSSRLEE
jgi:hypothetical protein